MSTAGLVKDELGRGGLEWLELSVCDGPNLPVREPNPPLPVFLGGADDLAPAAVVSRETRELGCHIGQRPR